MRRSTRIPAILLAAAALPLFLSHAQPGFSTLTTVRFEVKYQKGITADEARSVGDYLQQDYDYLSTRLKVDLAAPLEVRVYDASGKYLTATGQQKPWRPALFQRGVLHVQPVKDLTRQKTFEKGLSYELSLAVLEQTGGRGVPRWLREAFAAYHSGIMTDLTPPVGARVGSFADLDQDLQKYPVPPKRDDVQYLLGQTMKFFVEQYGEEKAIGVFAAFDGTHGLEETFTRHFGVPYKDIEHSWSEYIAHQSEPFRKAAPAEPAREK